MASSEFKQRYFCEGVSVETISSAPALLYDSNDALILQWINNTFDGSVKLIAPSLPSTKVILSSCIAGEGWAMLPQKRIGDALRSGALVALTNGDPLVKELYWHEPPLVCRRVKL